jgi:hypothetical protein
MPCSVLRAEGLVPEYEKRLRRLVLDRVQRRIG